MKEDSPHYNFGPPVALPFWFPLGFLSLRMASLIWYAAQLLCLFAAMRILGAIYDKTLGYVLWTVFLFAPVLFCERAGQLGLFLLLALLLFFTTLRQRPFIAGVCLAPLVLKPHILLPFDAF